jgi:chromosome segregation ATPase
LETAKSDAAKIAKDAGVERGALLALLAKQKAGKGNLTQTENQRSDVSHQMASLKSQANMATEDAVELARQSDDPSKIEAAKKKACERHGKYVDSEVKMAAAERAVAKSKADLQALSHKVELAIEKAKATGHKEAHALRVVAKDKMAVARAGKKQAEIEMNANVEASRAAQSEEQTLKSRETTVEEEVLTAERNLKEAETVQQKAEAAEAKAKNEKPIEAKINMRKIERKAEAIAQAMSTPLSSPEPFVSTRKKPCPGDEHDPCPAVKKPSAPQSDEPLKFAKPKQVVAPTVQVPDPEREDIHDKYAHEVEVIEKQLGGAQNQHSHAVKHLKTLQAKHAPAKEIMAAEHDVQATEHTVKTLMEEQTHAVAKVVAHIQKREPKYSARQGKTPTDNILSNQ